MKRGFEDMDIDAATDMRAWRWTIALIAGLTALRLLAVFASPLELYPDEAQYWLWSRHLDFGYFSKPPMIAWLIWATTGLGGDDEAFVRLAAPLLHAGAAVAVFFIGKRLYGAWAGAAAAAFYALMPAVQVSSLVISTDAPLLFFLTLSLAAYVHMPQAADGRRALLAAGAGAALGLAFLSKYAAIYGLAGYVLHALVSRSARQAWRPTALGAFAAAFCAVIAPNLIWNAGHKFATVEHTAANANLSDGPAFNIGELADFAASQFGVFGPIPFAVLVGGLVVLGTRRRLTPPDRLLLCFALPPLVVVLIQALLSRANANWAASAYVAGSILAAAWLLRWKARGWLIAALSLQGALAAVVLTAAVSPKAADALGLANGLKRARGWSASVAGIVERARTEGGSAGLSAVAVDDRFLFNAAAYYGRDYFGSVEAPPLKMWVHENKPHNQAETENPLTAADGGRVLAASLDGVYRRKMQADFASTSGEEIASVRLDQKRRRKIEMFVGEGFAPVPRDPATGKPPEPKF